MFKSTLQRENIELLLKNDELREMAYKNCNKVGCYFCEHRLALENNGNIEVCCEITQSKYCKDFVKKTAR